MSPEYQQFCDETVKTLEALSDGDDKTLDRVLESPRLIRSRTWVEFGVAGGGTLTKMVAAKGEAKVWGLDSFEGLTEAWHIQAKGDFAQSHPPNVPGAHIITGFFEDILPSFSPPDPVTLAHIDCDIYIGAKAALRWLWPRVISGTIVTFDEIWNYADFSKHEMLALYESSLGIRYEWIFAGRNQGSLVIL